MNVQDDQLRGYVEALVRDPEAICGPTFNSERRRTFIRLLVRAALTEDGFLARLDQHERPQFGEYMDMLLDDPEFICTDFNPSRREEFVRLLRKALDL